MGAVGTPAARWSGRRAVASSAAGSHVTAWVNRSATRVSAPACSSREPWPAPRLCGSTVRSVSSPVATGSQSGSVGGPGHHEAGDQVALERDQHPVAGVVGAAERQRASPRRSASASRAARTSAGSRSAYDARQARTWTAAIAAASSAQATRAETSALVMGAIQPSALSRAGGSVSGSCPAPRRARAGPPRRGARAPRRCSRAKPTTATGHHPARTPSPNDEHADDGGHEVCSSTSGALAAMTGGASQGERVQPEPEQPVEPDGERGGDRLPVPGAGRPASGWRSGIRRRRCPPRTPSSDAAAPVRATRDAISPRHAGARRARRRARR